MEIWKLLALAGNKTQMKNKIFIEGLIGVNDVCKILDIKLNYLRDLIYYNNIPHYKIGNLLRFKESDLLEWIKKHKVNSNDS
jgi:excisionase family DNA binding protein